MAYTKYHSSWSATDLLSGAAFNHLETQYDEAKDDADAHSHDARYYPKATADITFFSTSFYTGFDADLLDGNHLSDLLAAVMPIGAIMIWSGTDANVPASWHICDGGTYGGYATPDLRDRFVIGAGDTYAVGATGGPATWNGTITPTATVTIGAHAVTTAEMATHTHSYTEYYMGVGGQSCSSDNYASCLRAPGAAGITTNAMASGDGTHGHAGSTASFAGVDPRPAFHSLYYIMKYA